MSAAKFWSFPIIFIASFLLLPLSAIDPSNLEDDDDENVCKEFSSKTETNRLRHAMMNHDPFRIPMRKLLGEAAAGRHWDLFAQDDCFNLAVSRDAVFWGATRDSSSPVGFRRVNPALLECIHWPLLQSLMRYLSDTHDEAADADDTDARIPVPQKIRKGTFKNYNDILDEGPVPLINAVSQHRHGLFVDGQPASKATETTESNSSTLLTNITERLAKIVKRDPVQTRLWLSAGGVAEKAHFDEVHSWICQFAGEQYFDFVSPQHVENLYPLNFGDGTTNADFQTILTKDGQLIDELIPKEFRDDKTLLSAVVDEDDPDMFRFPKYVNATKTACRLEPGYCMWVPSFWWRSARSTPGIVNLALSWSFGAGLPVNKTKFDVQAAQFSYESLARVAQTEMMKQDWHTEL